MARNLELGAWGEELAAGHLAKEGLTILARNWRCRYGELDLIARDGDAVVFVEVKTRSGRGYGTPAEAVTFAKQGRIRRLAGLWLAEQPHGWRHVRFDVVAVVVESGRDPVLEHLRAVF
ncbi:YraN family protein [Rhodococcus oryzae]|uniref:YraN family protein n=1 Tax=Rhodococcus oryzae TaxID=2571143 RepID=UPI00371BBFB4